MEGFRNKSRFLYGESMGGAVALLLHRKDPAFWDGAVLAAPMCKVCVLDTRLMNSDSQPCFCLTELFV
jgi:alpha-beta hydrolase superfamily lysophospholipase